MRTMASVLTFAMLTVIATELAAAAGPPSPEARAKAAAPYLDRQTIAVGYVDVRRIEPKAFVDLYVRLVPEATVDRDQRVAALSQAISMLREHEFQEFYVVFSLADVPGHPPYVILPTGERFNVEKIVNSEPFRLSGDCLWHDKQGHALIAGEPRTLQRLKRQQPDPRPELVEAFRAAGDAAIQILLLPTSDHRRVVEAMLPQLPPEIDGGPSTVLTQGLQWMAVGLDPPPAISARAVVQAPDHAAATALREKWIAITRALEREQLPQAVRNYAKPAELLRPEVQGERLVLSPDEKAGGIEAILQAFTPPLEDAHKRVAKQQSANRLKQIALAMHNYHDVHGSLPAQAKIDANQKPLLSWRVLILPFLDQNKLYQQFHLDEPWDSPHNRTLIDQMPDVYRSPVSKLKEKGRTNYLLPIGEQTVYSGPRGVKFREITDGTSNTILVVEANDDQAAIWTKPDDLPFDPQQPAKGLGGLYGDGFWTAFCDGSVRFLRSSIDPAILRALFTRAGGEVVHYGDFH